MRKILYLKQFNGSGVTRWKSSSFSRIQSSIPASYRIFSRSLQVTTHQQRSRSSNSKNSKIKSPLKLNGLLHVICDSQLQPQPANTYSQPLPCYFLQIFLQDCIILEKSFIRLTYLPLHFTISATGKTNDHDDPQAEMCYLLLAYRVILFCRSEVLLLCILLDTFNNTLYSTFPFRV